MKVVIVGGVAVQVKNIVTNEDDLISLAGPANKQGRIVVWISKYISKVR